MDAIRIGPGGSYELEQFEPGAGKLVSIGEKSLERALARVPAPLLARIPMDKSWQEGSHILLRQVADCDLALIGLACGTDGNPEQVPVFVAAAVLKRSGGESCVESAGQLARAVYRIRSMFRAQALRSPVPIIPLLCGSWRAKDVERARTSVAWRMATDACMREPTVLCHACELHDGAHHLYLTELFPSKAAKVQTEPAAIADLKLPLKALDFRWSGDAGAWERHHVWIKQTGKWAIAERPKESTRDIVFSLRVSEELGRGEVRLEAWRALRDLLLGLDLGELDGKPTGRKGAARSIWRMRAAAMESRRLRYEEKVGQRWLMRWVTEDAMADREAILEQVRLICECAGAVLAQPE